MVNRPILSLLVLLSLVLPLAARAEGPVYLWGFQRGCERLPETDRYVEKHLHSTDNPVALLRTPAGKPLPACQGEECAQILRRACPAASGRLLGGQVAQGRDLTRFRLWLYDLSTGQIAWQDDYSENLIFDSVVVVQAKALLQNPRFGSVPGAKPTYCVQPSPALGASALPSGPIFLTVYGDGKHKSALHAALREQLQLLGRTVLPVSAEARSSSLDLQKIVAGQQNARVLGAEVKKDGTVDLFFYDQKTERTTDKSVRCADCSSDSLNSQVKQAVSDLLDYCFSDQCASSGLQPPVEACEPFPEKQCGGLDGMLASGTGLPSRYIDPTTAKIMKGSLWGIFAASAATGIGLFAANAAGPVQADTGQGVRNVLAIPAGAMVGVAGLTLILAIPSTLAINRALATNPASGGTAPASPIQCPN